MYGLFELIISSLTRTVYRYNDAALLRMADPISLCNIADASRHSTKWNQKLTSWRIPPDDDLSVCLPAKHVAAAGFSLIVRGRRRRR